MKKLEIGLIVIFLIGFALKLAAIPGGSPLITLSLGTLSLLYFYFSFALLNGVRFRSLLKKESYREVSTKEIVIAVAAGITLSNVTIGLAFKIQSWPGGQPMVNVGLLLSFIIAAIGVFGYYSTKSPFFVRVLKIVGFWVGIAILTMLL